MKLQLFAANSTIKSLTMYSAISDMHEILSDVYYEANDSDRKVIKVCNECCAKMGKTLVFN